MTNELETVKDVKELNREEQPLKSLDTLAIKGLAQFERFPAVMALGNLIENWHISDFHISKARPEQETGYAEHLSREGENLSLVIEYLYNNKIETFDKILSLLKMRVPGINQVESKTTEEGTRTGSQKSQSTAAEPKIKESRCVEQSSDGTEETDQQYL